jgi:hypothetical protein
VREECVLSVLFAPPTVKLKPVLKNPVGQIPTALLGKVSMNSSCQIESYPVTAT